MGPQSKIHRHVVSAGVRGAQSEQGLTLSPDAFIPKRPSATRNAEEKRSGTLERVKDRPLVNPTGIKISIALGLEKPTARLVAKQLPQYTCARDQQSLIKRLNKQ
ncbi:hypothetical protein NDU88_003970 [Pleurodeles waltl]|uniref:Uncharacterized protein n=1 Tax=Pleurodeles waltl TaxID=8319 RepID=A0AAV7WQJ7_PLEWA|nr:hypothetical protein NDU88_003970 [Pleurodeles waltl]